MIPSGQVIPTSTSRVGGRCPLGSTLLAARTNHIGFVFVDCKRAREPAHRDIVFRREAHLKAWLPLQDVAVGAGAASRDNIGISGILPIAGDAEAQVLDRLPTADEVDARTVNPVAEDEVHESGTNGHVLLKGYARESAMKHVDVGIDRVGLHTVADLDR